ncbi:uncharacterized protein F5891DRAFT_981197 [Suillus fuscotomentosus]|uniref:Uncharacterized protein n=1 Tax=Suillus fuscotomentosus TaxID=1912939 RepID=A0AAD4E4H6_9AGAM|nr:uncharacterized protein F5891DRAFT_981197 [Suillus fuscotomentosus]KAG1899437.1 hypothetical protein F5891DRAFT_981197 [Suillus fuscotomentosus]
MNNAELQWPLPYLGHFQILESNDVLALADKSSRALQQHSRTCSVISPFLLSVAAKVRATMNQGLAHQWSHVWADDPCMESHPFFAKTVRYEQPALAPAPAPAPPVSPVLPPAPEQMSILPIDSLPRASHAHHLDVPGKMTDKGKLSDRGTCQSREDSTDAEPGRKKQKVLKHVLKAIISDTEDEDRRPTGTIIVKARFTLIISNLMLTLPQRSKNLETSGAAPAKSKGIIKHSKQSSSLNHHQPDAEPKISRAQAKGKAKQKAVDIAEPIRGHPLLKSSAEEYTPLCKRCIGESCLVVIGRKGQAIKSCAKCHFMKASKPHPWSKATPASKSKAHSRTTRATSRIRPPTPIVESEDAVEDTGIFSFSSNKHPKNIELEDRNFLALFSVCKT